MADSKPPVGTQMRVQPVFIDALKKGGVVLAVGDNETIMACADARQLAQFLMTCAETAEHEELLYTVLVKGNRMSRFEYAALLQQLRMARVGIVPATDDNISQMLPRQKGGENNGPDAN